MPRASKKDKFYIYAPSRSGRAKGKRGFGINHRYEGGIEDLNLQDLLDFFREQKIDPSQVRLYKGLTISSVA